MASRRRAPESAGVSTAAAWRGWQTVAVAILLVAGIWLVYAQVGHFDFVELDDPLYVRENPIIAEGLTLKGVEWAFTHSHAAYWIPLTWISYMADVEIYGGVNAGGHHVTNVVLHAANVLILFGLLKRTTRAPVKSAFVAALFAVHPLHVESVAWITERKDVLSTLFWLLGIWAYVRYVERPGLARYAAIVGCLFLGLLAKPMLVTFPLVLLLLDVWPLGRVPTERVWQWQAWKRPVGEKAVLVAFVVAAGVVTYVAQTAFGAAPSLEAYPLGLRVENAVVSYGAYLRMTLWPSPLSAIYPLAPTIPAATVAGAAAVVTAVSVAVAWLGRRRPFLAVGWCWYLGTLIPVIGLVQVGVQARADRFMYVPSIGLFVMAVWMVGELASSRARRLVAATAGMLVVVAAGVQARHQVTYWEDSVAMWTHALQTTFGVSDFEAHRALGRTLAGKGRLEEARAHLEAALATGKSTPDVEGELARVLVQMGHGTEAIPHLKQVARAQPDIAEVRVELAQLLAEAGQFDAALTEYLEAERLKPSLGIDNNIGVLLAQMGRFSEALQRFEAAVRRGSDVETAQVNLGLALANLGRLPEARAVLNQVLQSNPRDPKARAILQELAGR
jgi:protein O-mannosyl-transferase